MVKNNPTSSPSITSRQSLLSLVGSQAGSASTHLHKENENAFSFTKPTDIPAKGSKSAKQKSNKALKATTVKPKDAIKGRRSPEPSTPLPSTSLGSLPPSIDVSNEVAEGNVACHDDTRNAQAGMPNDDTLSAKSAPSPSVGDVPVQTSPPQATTPNQNRCAETTRDEHAMIPPTTPIDEAGRATPPTPTHVPIDPFVGDDGDISSRHTSHHKPAPTPPQRALPTAKSMHHGVQTGNVPMKAPGNYSNVISIDGTFIDERPIPPPELFQALSKIVQAPIHCFLNSDGQQLYTPHDYNLEDYDESFPGPIKSYSVADHLSFDWLALVGRNSLVIPPDYLPFQDTGPFLSLKTFGKKCAEALEKGKINNQETNIFFGYLSKAQSPHYSILPTLDWKVDLRSLDGYVQKKYVLPLMKNRVRGAELQIVASTVPSEKPLILFHLSSRTKARHVPSIEVKYVHTIPAPSLIMHKPTHTLYHVRLDAPPVLEDGTPMRTSMDLLRRLNNLSPDDGSSVLRGMHAPRYPPNCLPQLVSGFGPTSDEVIAWDWFVPQETLTHLQEDGESLKDDGINFGILDNEENDRKVFLTHFPVWTKNNKTPKYSANKIRDSILVNKSLAKQFEHLVVHSKYDLEAKLVKNVNKTNLADTLNQLDRIRVIDQAGHQVIFPNGKISRVAPPQAIAIFPPSIDPSQVALCAQIFGRVVEHQPLPKAGSALLVFEHNESAQASYGAQLLEGITLTSGDNDTDHHDDLDSRISWLTKNFPQALQLGHQPLTAHSLALHSAQEERAKAVLGTNTGEEDESMDKRGSKRVIGEGDE